MRICISLYLGIFLLVCLILAGAWFGYWGVRKLVLTDEGLVDTDVAYFVKWAVLLFSGIMILQSSLDAILAAQALVIAIIASAISRTRGKFKFLHRLFRRIFKYVYYIYSKMQFPNRSEHTRHFQDLDYASPKQSMNRSSPRNNSNNLGLRTPNISYYSSFHKTPDRKRFKKEEWETFTREETRKALRELVSSPDFNDWAVENADRITLTPPLNAIRTRRRRIFGWWS